MKKQKNINMQVGKTMFRKLEQMDLTGLTTVRMAILAEMRNIQNAMQGNINRDSASLLKRKGEKLMQQMQRLDQLGRNLITKAIPTIPKELTTPEANDHGETPAVVAEP